MRARNGSERSAKPCRRRLLSVGAVQLAQIAINAVLNLRQAPLHLGASEVPVPVVDRLELGAINRNAGVGEQIKLTTERHEPGADLADRTAIILAEIGNRLVIGSQTEVAVNIELQKNRGVVRGPTGRLRIDTSEPEFAQIQFVNKRPRSPEPDCHH